MTSTTEVVRITDAASLLLFLVSLQDAGIDLSMLPVETADSEIHGATISSHVHRDEVGEITLRSIVFAATKF